MLKRFLFVLTVLFVFAGSALSFELPRWGSMPLTVYIPKDNYSQIVTNAFKNWQTTSKGTVRFLFRYSPNMRNISDIGVYYVDDLPGGNGYDVERVYNRINNFQFGRQGYFYKSNIYIATKNADGKPYNDNYLYSVTLRAVGEVLGIKSVLKGNAIMSVLPDYSRRVITSGDINALNKVYRSQTKYVK